MFKIKDLMIKIVPGEGAKKPNQPLPCPNPCSWESSCDITVCECTICSAQCSVSQPPFGVGKGCGLTCAPNSCKVCTFVCTDECSACSQQVFTCKCTNSPTCRVGTCGYGSCGRTYGREEGAPDSPLENLAALKAQLQQQLAQVEEQEKLVRASESPASVEEAEALEKKLVEALDEVKAIKARLKKKQ